MDKTTKSWGSGGELTGDGFFLQRPSKDELDENELKFGEEATTLVYNVTAEEAHALAEAWRPAPVYGGTGGTMTYAQSASPLGTLTLVTYPLMRDPKGVEPLDDVDYGSDGEGGEDPEVWSTAKNRKTTRNEYRIEWDDVTHWPPFMSYGHQLMDPAQVAAYKLLIGGAKPGDVYVLGGVAVQLMATGAGYDANYFNLLKEKVLVFKEITELSWVISSKAHAQKYDPGDPEKTVVLPDGTYMSTVCRENKGNKDVGEKKSWTVTRRFVHTELYDGQTVPEGAELYDVRTQAPVSNQT